MTLCTEENVAEYRDENNNIEKSIDLNALYSGSRYFQQVIRPMLAPGHESEFIFWLKNFGMIPNIQICKNANTDENCNKPMNWTPSRVQDIYQWRCSNCSDKKSIREGSVFCDVKCNFKNAIRIFLGWCNGVDYDSMAAILGIKKNIVCALYNISARIVEDYMKKHITEFQIGGPGVIVLVDTYPVGCGNREIINRGYRPILCLSEVKSMPQKVWFQSLERNRTTQQFQQNKEKIVNFIKEIVKPGSVLVVPSESQLCLYDDIRQLNNLYPTIITVESLKRHNTFQITCEDNLNIIWKKALNICEQAQFYSSSHMQQFLVSQMWHQKFGSESFERLLHQFSVYQ